MMNTQKRQGQEQRQGVLSKTALLFVLLVVSIGAVGCGGGAGSAVSTAPADSNPVMAADSASVSAARWTAADITYNIALSSSSYNAAADTTTFNYHVVSNPNGGPAISHWLLLIPEDCTNAITIAGSNDSTAGFGRDGSTGYTGLKFDTGYEDKESRDVTVTLQGHWAAGDIQILVKAGNGFVIGTAPGPVCVAAPPVEHVVSGSVFLDVAVNNVRDADEPAVPGISVALHDEAGNAVAEAATNNDGTFSFTVPAGVYSVTFSIPAGLKPSGPISIPVDVTESDSTGNDAGVSVDFSYIGTQTANGLTIGFWKTNLSKAISGKIKGIQVDSATLQAYVNQISVFGLAPLNVTTMSQAYDILNANGSDASVLLSKQLMGSEFNLANQAFIGGNEMLTKLFLLHGEYLLAHSEMFSRDILLQAQQWYDAYNNSHGAVIMP